ncbi:MAG: hypothetical protein J6T71_06705 [Paludibacteraceae bacterium]|nr:hypothetical protein [Paludibacteraceae bacterium]
MKKVIALAAAVAMLAGCGFLKNSTSSNTAAQPTATAQTAQTGNTAVSAGQGVGNALLALYNQYKADGNKYDYKNMQNVLNTVTLLANCEGLKDNYKDKSYLKEFGKGMVASSLGLVTQNNVETVTNSLVDMVKNSEAVQSAKTQTSTAVQNASTTAAGYADTAASYANTAAQYAGALSTLLGAFSGK